METLDAGMRLRVFEHRLILQDNHRIIYQFRSED